MEMNMDNTQLANSNEQIASVGGWQRPFRALVLDDDKWALRLIRFVLEEALPGITIDERETPDIQGEYDVYIVDNDFEGARWASRIVPYIRERQPSALIVAFSGTLDRTTLKSLLNAGCDMALEKGRPDDLEELSRATRSFAKSRREAPQQPRGVIESARVIRDLIHEWNMRLGREEEVFDEA